VFPSQIEYVLTKLGMEPNYLIVVDRVNNHDTLEVQVEMTANTFSDSVKVINKLESKIASELKTTLNIAAKVVLVEPKTLARSEGKAKRVLDNRKL